MAPSGPGTGLGDTGQSTGVRWQPYGAAAQAATSGGEAVSLLTSSEGTGFAADAPAATTLVNRGAPRDFYGNLLHGRGRGSLCAPGLDVRTRPF